MATTYTVRIKRGLKANLPTSAGLGELIFCTDTQELFCGAGLSNPLDLVSGPQTIGPISSFSKQPPTNLYAVPDAVGPFAISSVGTSSGGTVYYTGHIAGVTRYSSLGGMWFVVSGFTNPANNGIFLCYGASPTLLLLSNASAVAETINPSIADGLATREITNPAVSNGVGCFGFSFQVSTPITVSRLGRQYVSGNSHDHAANLWDNSNTVTPIASGTVLAASASDSFGVKWVSVTPVVLVPDVRYSIAIDEDDLLDAWQDFVVQFYLQDQFPVSVNTATGACSNIVAVAGAAGSFPADQAPVDDSFGIGMMYDAPAMMFTYIEEK